MVRTRPSACKMCNTKAGMISYRGFCKKCGDKAIVAGSKHGGHSGIGDAKRRAHSNNGRFTPQQQDYKTWKSLDLKISDFELLLRTSLIGGCCKYIRVYHNHGPLLEYE